MWFNTWGRFGYRGQLATGAAPILLAYYAKRVGDEKGG